MTKTFEQGFKEAPVNIQCLVVKILSSKGKEQEKYLAQAYKIINDRKKYVNK